MKRIFWLAVGLGAGVTTAVLVARWTRRQRERLSPANIGAQASEGVRDLGRLLREAVDEGRRGMAAKEAEIRGQLPG